MSEESLSIDALEAMAGTNINDGGNAPSVDDAPAGDTATVPTFDIPVPRKYQVAADDVKGMSPRETALTGLSPEMRELVIAEAAAVGIRVEWDLSWLLVGAQVRSWAAAAAAGDAARLVHEDVLKLPKTMQDALLYASKDFDGQVRDILGKSGGEFIRALKKLIIDSADSGATKLREAASTLDGELTRKIEIRKDEGVELWVQRANDAASLAIAKHKAVNFYFNTMGGATIFILGAAFGAFLATHI